ncbi:hypothetical protein [Roseinatronobacter monicus]|uniref:Uncharacterized protein n=1 Tax=Roseinatronobacter monicus TaxID=393481 RepID=A0A543KBG5_9RHOB|nr:hypothetical protein [Roseinatronobacter monicus]TQM92428.1 hypothetical protein BD293_1034 [Roseinatronobacter monicus]
MKLTFPHKDRIWENSISGLLTRVNAYYILYPYIFGFHDEEFFRNASAYAAYEAHNYFLGLNQSKLVELGSYEIWQEYLSLNGNLVANFVRSLEEVSESSSLAYKKLSKQGGTPNRPNFVCRVSKSYIKDQKRKLRGAAGAEELPDIPLFEDCSNEEAISQREIVAKFCVVLKAISKKRSDALLTSEQKSALQKFPKYKVSSIVCSHCFENEVKEIDVNDIVNWYSAIVPLIYAMSSCVEFSHHMRDNFIESFPVIVARHNEMYEIVVKEMLNNGNEQYFNADKVLLLDLPLPPDMRPLPRPSVGKNLDLEIMKAVTRTRLRRR